ncbi:hypothetical protein HanHA300_Chr08g0284671 [Helianthus annuus]|nr:hypothetical protein HanHA300_Chr08g0284671 [Helianthus annuus]KAJ0719595.1 hypothetical protein HanLR1_Chr08g0283491 [Helianthus annuus]
MKFFPFSIYFQIETSVVMQSSPILFTLNLFFQITNLEPMVAEVVVEHKPAVVIGFP